MLVEARSGRRASCVRISTERTSSVATAWLPQLQGAIWRWTGDAPLLRDWLRGPRRVFHTDLEEIVAASHIDNSWWYEENPAEGPNWLQLNAVVPRQSDADAAGREPDGTRGRTGWMLPQELGALNQTRTAYPGATLSLKLTRISRPRNAHVGDVWSARAAILAARPGPGECRDRQWHTEATRELGGSCISS